MAVFLSLLMVVLLIGGGLELLWLAAVVGLLVGLIALTLGTGSRSLRAN